MNENFGKLLEGSSASYEDLKERGERGDLGWWPHENITDAGLLLSIENITAAVKTVFECLQSNDSAWIKSALLILHTKLSRLYEIQTARQRHATEKADAFSFSNKDLRSTRRGIAKQMIRVKNELKPKQRPDRASVENLKTMKQSLCTVRDFITAAIGTKKRPGFTVFDVTLVLGLQDIRNLYDGNSCHLTGGEFELAQRCVNFASILSKYNASELARENNPVIADQAAAIPEVLRERLPRIRNTRLRERKCAHGTQAQSPASRSWKGRCV